MKRNLTVLAVAALLIGTIATGAEARGGHMGGFHGGPFMGGVMSSPPVSHLFSGTHCADLAQAPVSPASPGSVFH